MKRLFILASRFLLVFAILSPAAHAAHNKAIIRAIRDGNAEISRDNGKTWKKAEAGTVLAANSAVRTDANATVDIFMGENGPVVRLTRDTMLGFDKLEVENAGIEKIIETQLNLKRGRIYGNVKKTAAASKYEIKTPVGVVGIRGTEYALAANGDLQVLSGTAVAVYILNGPPDGGQAIVQARQQLSIVPGGRVEVSAISQTLNEIQNEFARLTIGVTTLPNGTIAATFENPNKSGQTLIIGSTLSGALQTPSPAYDYFPPIEEWGSIAVLPEAPFTISVIAGHFDITNIALTQFFPPSQQEFDVVNEPLFAP